MLPFSQTEPIAINWVWAYGVLGAGEYRFAKDVSAGGPGNRHRFVLYDYFVVVE